MPPTEIFNQKTVIFFFMQRRGSLHPPELGSVARHAINKLYRPQYTMCRSDLLCLLIEPYFWFLVFWFFPVAYCAIQQYKIGIFNFKDQYHILAVLAFSMIPILFFVWSLRKSYQEAIRYRRWVEGLGLEPASFFEKEVNSGQLKMEDIDPDLLMAGPVAGRKRYRLWKMKRINVRHVTENLVTAAAESEKET